MRHLNYKGLRLRVKSAMTGNVGSRRAATLMLTLMLAMSMGGFAQDTIRLTWNAGTTQKQFFVAATNGENFKVDWGDGSTPDSKAGFGATINVGLTHIYASAGTYPVTVIADDANCRFLFLQCPYENISSLDIGNCTVLTNLSCYNNSLSNLNLSNNTALIYLYCRFNSLSNLDVSNNTALTHLDCYGNSLLSLDVSKNTALTYLDCNNNSLSVLGVSKNTALKWLYCCNNSLSILDVSKNTALTDLRCHNNSLLTLDVSNNTELTILSCYSNSLPILDVSKNTKLTNLDCANNFLSILDVSNNTALTELYCLNNRIPLSDLYIASEILKNNNSSNRYLGSQTLLPKNVLKGKTLFTDQSVFNTEYTKYIVKQGGSPANASDYTVTNGKITFHTLGIYDVIMANDSIISHASFPAEVTIELTVEDAGTDASLSNLTVSQGSLTPAFSSTTYNYTVAVPYSVSSITLTATPADVNAHVSGAGAKPLNVGDNPFTITVTAEDGTTTQHYLVTITRATDVGIEQLPITNYELRVYPNPTTGQLTIGISDMRFSDMRLFDMMGRQILIGQSEIGQSEIGIDVSTLSQGVYFVKIETDNGIVTRKFVKE